MRNMKPLLSVLTILFAASAQADTSLENAVWQVNVSEPRVEFGNWEDVFENNDSHYFPTFNPDQINMPSMMIDFDKLVIIGEKIIEIIKANQPVVNVKRDHVGVVPMGVNDWGMTAGWKLPISRKVDITLYSLAGIKLAQANVKVIANHGGSVNGKGKFLKNVTLVPSNIKAYVGHSVDLWTEFRDPVNISNSVDNPTAALGFDIRYSAASIASRKEGARDVVVTGDGTITVSE